MQTKRSGQVGLTLVEVMVASVILGLSISALTIMIGHSDVISLESDHFRQARLIAQHELEDSWSSFLNYGADHQSWDMFLDLNAPDRIALNARDSVDADATDRIESIGGENVPYRVIKATVSWTEKSGRADTLILSKRITDLR